jgi:hypothetical protein
MDEIKTSTAICTVHAEHHAGIKQIAKVVACDAVSTAKRFARWALIDFGIGLLLLPTFAGSVWWWNGDGPKWCRKYWNSVLERADDL